MMKTCLVVTGKDAKFEIRIPVSFENPMAASPDTFTFSEKLCLDTGNMGRDVTYSPIACALVRKITIPPKCLDFLRLSNSGPGKEMDEPVPTIVDHL